MRFPTMQPSLPSCELFPPPTMTHPSGRAPGRRYVRRPWFSNPTSVRSPHRTTRSPTARTRLGEGVKRRPDLGGVVHGAHRTLLWREQARGHHASDPTACTPDTPRETESVAGAMRYLKSML
jgi:hypothetical protein